MPQFRKLSAAETAALEQPSIGARAEIAQEYDAYLADFAIGDYGRVALYDGERRTVVRQRLQTAARRRGFALCFRSGPGALTFRVAATPVISSTPPQEPVEAARMAAPMAGRLPQRPPRPPHRQTAAERYHAVLPRWMREGQSPDRRNAAAKRRPR